MQIQHLLFIGLIAATAAPSLGNFSQFNSQVTSARAEADRIGEEMTELQLAQQEQAQEQKVANDRYNNGCLPVVDDIGFNYVALMLNSPVLDRASEQPLPPGPIVCDGHGNTGVMVDDDNNPETPAVVQKMAFTGDRQVVLNALARFDPANYATPSN